MVYFAMLRLNPFFYFRQKRGDDGRCYSVYVFLILVNKALWPIGNKTGLGDKEEERRSSWVEMSVTRSTYVMFHPQPIGHSVCPDSSTRQETFLCVL